MNHDLKKYLINGAMSGVAAAIICIAISAVMTRVLGKELDVPQLLLGGLTVGVITFTLTLVISGIIRYAKR